MPTIQGKKKENKDQRKIIPEKAPPNPVKTKNFAAVLCSGRTSGYSDDGECPNGGTKQRRRDKRKEISKSQPTFQKKT